MTKKKARNKEIKACRKATGLSIPEARKALKALRGDVLDCCENPHIQGGGYETITFDGEMVWVDELYYIEGPKGVFELSFYNS